MAIIFMNISGSYSGGGPNVFAARARDWLNKHGHKVIFSKPHVSDIALCIIESGKIFRQIDRNKTKVAVRLDGAYFKEYWHSKTPDRMWRPDMTSLHNAIKRDVQHADVMIYQSKFSKNIIDDEIAKRSDRFVVIGNGVDCSLFCPSPGPKSSEIKLGHIGMMRNGYLMEMLIGTFIELQNRGVNVSLTLCGSMDAECQKVFSKHKSNKNIHYLGQVNNGLLPQVYSKFDIFLAPRQGSSCDNVVVEAQASGVPVVVPSWGGNAENVIDRTTGVIVQTGHWTYDTNYINGMAAAVQETSLRLDEYKKNARLYAEKHLSIDNMMTKYLKAWGIIK